MVDRGHASAARVNVFWKRWCVVDSWTRGCVGALVAGCVPKCVGTPSPKRGRRRTAWPWGTGAHVVGSGHRMHIYSTGREPCASTAFKVPSSLAYGV